MILYQLYTLSLVATVLGSMSMAGFLWFKSGRKDIVKPLVFFCIGVAAWVTGYLLIATGGSYRMEAGKFLINLSPLIAAAFLHFVLNFSNKSRKTVISALYLIAALSVVIATLFHAGEIGPWLRFSHFYHLDRAGIALASLTALFSLVAHLILLNESMRADKKKQRQMLALFISGGWGLLAASGFVFESIGLNIFPYPVLLLPVYTLLLTYGILRYELMDVNVWARRTLTWLFILLIPLVSASVILALLVKFGLTQFSETSLWLIWSLSLAVVLLASLLQKPASFLAERIVYPGNRIRPEMLKKWQSELEATESWEQLSTIGGRLISGHMGYAIEIFASPTLTDASSDGLGIRCDKKDDEWGFTPLGWDEAAPAVLRTVNLFGTLLVSASTRLESLLKIAEREKDILIEGHLTDLGRLSATVAHELRNPLNVISMVSASCDDEIKREIHLQIERSQKLIDDLLTYSGKLSIEKKRLNLKDEVECILSHYKERNVDVTIDISDDLVISFDSHRLHQVFFNLMNNACSVLKETENPHITIKASTEKKEVKVVFNNNGPEIPENIAGEIFRPFVSGRAGGSGLGLAIVQRIMEAHGGKVELRDRESGNCRFELNFPMEQ